MFIPRSIRVIFLLMPLTLVACSGDDTSAAPADTPVVSGDDSDVPEEVREAMAFAEENDLLFATSHDELVRLSNEVGTLRILTSSRSFEALQSAFGELYPELDVHVEHFTDTDTYQRFLLEAAAGQTGNWDVAYAPPEHYAEFTDLMAPYDMLGMSQAGVLDIPEDMIDPDKRFVAALGSQLGAIAYNVERMSDEDLPDTWEDLLDERFNSDNTQFVLDVRPSNVAPLVDVWGIDRLLEYSEELAAQEPLFVRGQADALTRLAAGESTLHVFSNYHTAVEIRDRAPGVLEVKLIEPVPVRLGQTLGVFNPEIANNPAGALLFIEWMAGPEGQAIANTRGTGSLYAEESEVAEVIKGKEVSVADFEHFANLEDYLSQIVEAFGFPSAG